MMISACCLYEYTQIIVQVTVLIVVISNTCICVGSLIFPPNFIFIYVNNVVISGVLLVLINKTILFIKDMCSRTCNILHFYKVSLIHFIIELSRCFLCYRIYKNTLKKLYIQHKLSLTYICVQVIPELIKLGRLT